MAGAPTGIRIEHLPVMNSERYRCANLFGPKVFTCLFIYSLFNEAVSSSDYKRQKIPWLMSV
jgi:hypothetical protein